MPWKVSGPKPQGFRVWGLGGEKLLRTTRGISEIQACAAPRNLQAGSIVLQAVECAVLERVLSGGFSALGPGLCGFGIASGLNCPRLQIRHSRQGRPIWHEIGNSHPRATLKQVLITRSLY